VFFVRLIFFGTPEFAVLPFYSLLNSEHSVLAVVTQPDRKRGRGAHVSRTPVKTAAQESGITVLQPERVSEPDFISDVQSFQPSVIVVAAYGQILPSEIINLPEYGCVNIHASLLPMFRGAAPVNWAIIRGEKETGVTTMLMDEGMDTGPVLLKRETGILAEDTAGSLSQRLSGIGAEVLLETLKGLELGNLVPAPQTGEVSYAPLLKKTDGLISWSGTARELSDFIRGMNPWPGAYSFLKGERIKILRAIPLEGDAEPGMIVKISKDELLAGTGKGLLSIREIQPPGKKAMPVTAFLQGRAFREGISFNV
jgi:methionyl-tRNA formyltransferase